MTFQHSGNYIGSQVKDAAAGDHMCLTFHFWMAMLENCMQSYLIRDLCVLALWISHRLMLVGG